MHLISIAGIRNFLNKIISPITRRLDLDDIDRYWNYPRTGNTYLESYHYSRKLTESTDDLAKQFRFHSLMQAVEHIISKKIKGDIVECGCWRGHSAHMIASQLKNSMWNGNFFIFDSFNGGLSDKCSIDRAQQGNTSFKKTLEQKKLFASDKDKVAQILAPFNFVSLHMGWIPEVFSQVQNINSRRYALVHIDVDLYEPTLSALRQFGPNMVKGGIIVVDDYGSSHFPGATTAVNEYIDENPPALSIEGQTGGILLIY